MISCTWKVRETGRGFSAIQASILTGSSSGLKLASQKQEWRYGMTGKDRIRRISLSLPHRTVSFLAGKDTEMQEAGNKKAFYIKQKMI